jgi:hypothetical protein
MLHDVTFQVKEIPSMLNDMDKVGIQSICKYLDLPVKGLEFLEQYQLLELVFNHVDSSMEDDVITLRMNDDVPIGVPAKNATLKNLQLKEGYLMDKFEVELNKLKTSKKNFKKIFDNEIEFLPKDVYKIGIDLNLDILSNNINSKLALLRLWCTNGCTVNDSQYMKNSFNVTRLEQMIDMYQYDEPTKQLIHNEVRNKLIKLQKRNTNVNDLLLLSRIQEGLNLYNNKLTNHINEGVNEIIEVYESPSDIYKVSDKTINLFPKEWKETAILPNTSAYDTWNIATDAISRYEEEVIEEQPNNLEEVKQDIFSFNIKLGEMLVYNEKQYAKMK